jgi:hypothetical protein
MPKKKIYRIEQRAIVVDVQYLVAESKAEAKRKFANGEYNDDFSDTKDMGDTTTSVKVFVADENESSEAMDIFQFEKVRGNL